MDSNGRSQLQIDLTGAVVRPPTLIVGRSFKGSPCLTPTSSPSPRRVSPTVRTPPNRADACCCTPKRYSNSRFAGAIVRSFFASVFSGRRLLPWIVFIALWTAFGLHVQFNWFYMENLSPSNEEINAHVPLERRSLEISAFDPDSNNGGAEGRSFLYNAVHGHAGKAVWSMEWVWGVFKGVRDHRSAAGANRGEEKRADVSAKDEAGKLRAPPEQQHWSLPRISSRQEAEELTQGLDMLDDSLPGSSADEGSVWNAPPSVNYSIGTLVGPFEKLEASVLGAEDERKQGWGCQADSLFAKLVNGRSFVIVLHELSVTGAPLSMLELGTKMRSCGGRVSAVVLNKQGGLLSELVERGIRILQDKAHHSWTSAAKADLVVVGSAACASWIGQYLKSNPKGGDRLVWWVMENRREYFDRAKYLLGRPKALLFLSDIQSTLWKEWCRNESLPIAAHTEVVALSVNEQLASVAGLANSSNYQLAEKRAQLREEVRRGMGLEPNDVLVASLSSINPGKGQLLLLQAALMVVDHVENEGLAGLAHVETNSALEWRSRRTFLTGRQIFSLADSFSFFSIFKDRGSHPPGASGKEKHSGAPGKDKKSRGGESKSLLGRGSRKARLPLAKGKKSSLKQRGQNFVRNTILRLRPKAVGSEGADGSPRLRILIGSIGSKSNKLAYLEKISRLLDRSERLAKLTLSTPSTIHVASLYAAADVYVMNAQGIGETFGRVTVEAMAFGLPVLATNAGGSKEIISRNVTGLLHPIGRAGVPVLAQHIRRLLDHRAQREQMGRQGRDLVDRLYREHMMYEKLAQSFKKVLDDASS
ncbi:hypothetical protein MPTK1_1g05790 [Marchantia polymorpha subsp. ruderalis]|uniref:Glycosyl transferase family 1 domain-containing protein n=2 Tax=Marchantia polymorpha TaxID=3197 RepID=A0AAF6ALX7_MARPO|nr:hypothetical protein MARPO_0005s0028 [Marchantia polymorpha]BBM97447.1 hypothetical protein Mp_1g05790 [Marchantia polymorpha subsp. ruderalis]|eukprot:PTQ48356.1 hypothetical protein MARPO_0005s0028 [Marchantia polymorpha]